MLVQIITDNGVKKIMPLTADAGAGNPVGTIVSMYKKSSPSGYLYCDGSTFDETQYPLLYAYLGSNTLPDYREFALVGAEENTTDVYNASTNPTGTIHDHDVYTEGQAKDDQIQSHQHTDPTYPNGSTGQSGWTTPWGTRGADHNLTWDAINVRQGTTTHGKRKAVYFYIKATSGLSENAQDNVVAQLNEERSYSTDEINTGKKWIDGKDIFRKCYSGSVTSASQTISHGLGGNISDVIDLKAVINISGLFIPAGYYYDSEHNVSVYINGGNFTLLNTHTGGTYKIIFEYTKTT